MLYWFRTPPYVKVGRSAFDPETIRLLEARHPDIAFDWNRMLKEPPQAPPPELDRRREVREAREARQARRRRAEGMEKVPEVPEVPQVPEVRVLEVPREEPAEPLDDLLEEAAEPLDEEVTASVAAGLADEFETEGAALHAPTVEGIAEAVSSFGAADLVAPEAGTAHPLLALLGSDGLMRLRARHAALLARIADLPDLARRDALRADAALVDPDGWLTAEEARAGLETYEARYEALRSALGVRRKRRRRRGGRADKPAV